MYRTRVVIATIVAVATLAVSVALGSSHDGVLGPMRTWGRTYQSRSLGFALSYPPTWHRTTIPSVCMADFSGVMVSNVLNAYQNPESAHGCYWPPHMDTLPSNGVVVLVDVLLGGPMMIEQTLSPDTRLPLTMADLRRAGGTRRYANVTFHHVDRYSVQVWVGTDASAPDRRTTARVLGSIHPWSCPAPRPSSVSAWAGGTGKMPPPVRSRPGSRGSTRHPLQTPGRWEATPTSSRLPRRRALPGSMGRR